MDFEMKINQFESEYKRKLFDKENQKDVEKPNFSIRLNDILDISSMKINEFCKKELDELNKNLQSDFLEKNELIPLPGKEKQAEETYKKFSICSFYPNYIVQSYRSAESALISFNKKQMNLCKEDCIIKSNMDFDLAKSCLKNCVDFAFDFSRKASYEVIDELLEGVEREIRKI